MVKKKKLYVFFYITTHLFLGRKDMTNLCVCVYLCVCVCVKLFSHVRLFATPWTVAHQAPLYMGFSGKNTGMGCCALLQEIFLIQGLNSFSLLFSGIGRRVLYH